MSGSSSPVSRYTESCDGDCPSSSFNFLGCYDGVPRAVVLDTNVIVDAMNAEYKQQKANRDERRAYHVVAHALNHYTVRFTQPTLDELQLVMERPAQKIDSPAPVSYRQGYLLRLLGMGEHIEIVSPGPLLRHCRSDYQDNKILKAASSGDGAFVLVSSDSDLTRMKQVGQTQILYPRAYLSTVAGLSLREIPADVPMRIVTGGAVRSPASGDWSSGVSEAWEAALQRQDSGLNKSRKRREDTEARVAAGGASPVQDDWRKAAENKVRAELGAETMQELRRQGAVLRSAEGRDAAFVNANGGVGKKKHKNKKRGQKRTAANDLGGGVMPPAGSPARLSGKNKASSPLAMARAMGLVSSGVGDGRGGAPKGDSVPSRRKGVSAEPA